MNNSINLALGDVSFTLVDPSDAEFILDLRSDPDLSRHLSPTPNDLQQQKRWIENYKIRESEGSEYYFLIHNGSRKVGTVRMYDFQGPSFCWGSWIISRQTEPHVAISTVILIYDFAFDKLGFQECHFDIYSANTSVKRFKLRMGAEIIRSDGLNDHYRIGKDSYQKFRPKLMRLACGKR